MSTNQQAAAAQKRRMINLVAGWMLVIMAIEVFVLALRAWWPAAVILTGGCIVLWLYMFRFGLGWRVERYKRRVVRAVNALATAESDRGSIRREIGRKLDAGDPLPARSFERHARTEAEIDRAVQRATARIERIDPPDILRPRHERLLTRVTEFRQIADGSPLSTLGEDSPEVRAWKHRYSEAWGAISEIVDELELAGATRR